MTVGGLPESCLLAIPLGLGLFLLDERLSCNRAYNFHSKSVKIHHRLQMIEKFLLSGISICHQTMSNNNYIEELGV